MVTDASCCCVIPFAAVTLQIISTVGFKVLSYLTFCSLFRRLCSLDFPQSLTAMHSVTVFVNRFGCFFLLDTSMYIYLLKFSIQISRASPWKSLLHITMIHQTYANANTEHTVWPEGRIKNVLI